MNSKLGAGVASAARYLILLVDAVMTVSGRITTIQLVSPVLTIVRCEA